MSIFNHLDFDRQAKIKKDYFTGEIRRYMRVRAAERKLSISMFCPADEKSKKSYIPPDNIKGSKNELLIPDDLTNSAVEYKGQERGKIAS